MANKKNKKELLNEELKKFNMLSEYSFYEDRSDEDKINDVILTSKDVLDHINYLMIINPNFNQLNSNQQFEISKNEMIKLKIKKIEI